MTKMKVNIDDLA